MKHGHYFRDVAHLQTIDVYRVLELFGVTDQALGHAIKKLVVAGGRGHKDVGKDVSEAIDTLVRWQNMRHEDEAKLPKLEPGASRFLTPEEHDAFMQAHKRAVHA